MRDVGGAATGLSLPAWREYRAADRQGCLQVFESNVPKFLRSGERHAPRPTVTPGGSTESRW